MAKVFISFLGTTPYSKVTYVYNKGQKSKIKTQTRFVQVALVNSICRSWDKNDRIIIFRTEKSNELNWKDRKDKDGKNIVGLETELHSYLSKNNKGICLNIGEEHDDKKYIVPTGFNENDLWEIFGKVYDNVNEGDEIYFDVTHAFRTIPLFTTVLFNYCRFMKNSVVKSIHYGAYENIFTLKELNKMTDEEKEKLEVPLVDLTNVVLLQTVNDSVSNFRQFGSFGSLVDVLDTDLDKQDELGQVDVSEAIDDIQVSLEDLNFYIMTSNLVELKKGRYIKTIMNAVDQIGNSSIPKPQKELLHEIARELTDFGFRKNNSYLNIEAAIKWLIEKNQLQQAVTLASEYVQETYLKLYVYNNFKVGETENENKNCMSHILSAKKRETNRYENPYVFVTDKWKDKVKLKGFIPQEVLDFINIEGVGSIHDSYDELRILRNQLNHAGDGEKYKTIYDLKDHFSKIWDSCYESLEQIEKDKLWE